MSRAATALSSHLSRRRFLQGAAAAASGLLLPGWTQRGAVADHTVADGFLDPDELQLVEALSARIISGDDGTPGAREARVVDYIQALLSTFPGADANRDERVSAADLVAIATAVGGSDAAADVDGNGRLDDRDRAVTAASIFAAPVLAGPPAFAGRPLYAGGPFSGRQPYPDPTDGTPSNDFPPNAFRQALPLSRLQRMAWTARLHGAGAVPELRDNPLAHTLPDVDLRRRYRDGLAHVEAISQRDLGAPFAALATEQQDQALAAVRREQRAFYDLLVDHTIEGLLAAPEYGGNRDLIGWSLIGFDGDSQPLGYTIYDAGIDDYRERADKPNSRIDPDDPCLAFGGDMLAFLRLVMRLTGGTEFPAPFCYPG